MLIEKDILGKTLAVAGATLLVIGTFCIGGSPSDQLILSMSWFFGAIFLVVGLVLGFELFMYSTTTGKLGVFLMSVSAVFMITGLLLFAFTAFNIRIIRTVTVFHKGVAVPNVVIDQIHPYEWAVAPLAQVAIFLFAAGLLLKFYDEIF